MADEQKTKPPPQQGPTTGERTALAMESFARSAARLVELVESIVPPIVAPASELDSQYGDPLVPFEVSGHPGCKGMRMSLATPEALEELAETLEYMARYPRQGKERFAPNNRRDAARARGWAKRLRAGWKPTSHTNGSTGPAGAAPPSFTTPPSFGGPPPASTFNAPPPVTPPPNAGDAWEPPSAPPPAPAAPPPTAAPPTSGGVNWDED